MATNPLRTAGLLERSIMLLVIRQGFGLQLKKTFIGRQVSLSPQPLPTNDLYVSEYTTVRSYFYLDAGSFALRSGDKFLIVEMKAAGYPLAIL